MKKLNVGNKQAFTLVELIVVITILIILGTIAFISLEGYSKNSRDGVRVADVNSARKSLELFITEKGFYPIPDNPTNIIYSGATAWIQGTIGDGVIRNLDKIDKKIVDPLTETEYTYSVTSSKTEYQIGAISEGGTIGYELPINQTHAATEKKATAMIRGTYNERFLRVQSGSLNWILAIPSIIATDITQTDVQTILTNNKLVYNNYQNIPHSYNNAGYTMTGGFNYTNANPLVYSGSLKNLTESNTGKLTFITNLKQAYNGTILQLEANYQDIVNNDTTNQTGSIYLVNRFINTNLGGIKVSNIILPTSGITQTTSTYNCIGSLVTENADIRNTEELTEDTIYQDDNLTGSCYYTCKNGFTGDDCNSLSIYASCSYTGELLTSTSTYGSCNSPDIIVCAGTNSGHTLAACNIGTNISGTGQLASGGKYFQWGRNKGFLYSDSSQQPTTIPGSVGLNESTDMYGFVWNSTLASPYTWANTNIENNWGNTTDTYDARQGPCLSGYHVPTQSEWLAVVTSGGWSSASWIDDGTRIMNALKLPMAGFRYRYDGDMRDEDQYGYYWSSYTTSTETYVLYLNPSTINPNHNNYRANGCSIRCFKN